MRVMPEINNVIKKLFYIGVQYKLIILGRLQIMNNNLGAVAIVTRYLASRSYRIKMVMNGKLAYEISIKDFI